jgi:hypothetical protein
VDHKGHHTLASSKGSYHDWIQTSHSFDHLSPPQEKHSFQNENGKLSLGNEELEMLRYLSSHNSTLLLPFHIKVFATPKNMD